MKAFEVGDYETGENAHSYGFTYYNLGVYLQIKLKTGFFTIATVVSPETISESTKKSSSSTYNFNGHKLRPYQFDGQRLDNWWSYREKAE